MSCISFLQLRRAVLQSVSTLAVLATTSAVTLAQQNDNTPQQPQATPTPQPSASPAAEPPPAQAGAPPSAVQQPAAGNVLPETRVVAPVERRQPRKPPTRVVTNQPPAPTQTQAQVAAQNDKLDAARKTIFTTA